MKSDKEHILCDKGRERKRGATRKIVIGSLLVKGKQRERESQRDIDKDRYTDNQKHRHIDRQCDRDRKLKTRKLQGVCDWSLEDDEKRETTNEQEG